MLEIYDGSFYYFSFVASMGVSYVKMSINAFIAIKTSGIQCVH